MIDLLQKARVKAEREEERGRELVRQRSGHCRCC
jgi:hypothetical protein